MRLTIFGASGATGGYLVEQACAAEHEVTAVVRDAAKVTARHPALTVVEADVMDPGAIRPHVAGRDAVISAIGNRSAKAQTTVQTDSTRSILRAMEQEGVARFLVISNCGMIDDPADGPFTRRVVKPVLWRILGHPWADMASMEQVVRDSAADWTILRPPQLTNGPSTARYRTAVDGNVRGGNRISRADLAHCALRNLDAVELRGKAVAVAN